MSNFLFHFLIILSFSALKSNSQQEYSGLSIFACNATYTTDPSPDFLYACNGKNRSCKSFFIFRSRNPIYNTIANISKLLSANPSELLKINNISSNAPVLPEYKEVIVPVNCSSSKQYYEYNTSYNVTPGDNIYNIAFGPFQSLATCDAVMKVNRDNVQVYNLTVGSTLRIPLRCACPTRAQIRNGTRFLVTYVPMNDDSIPRISENFNITNQDLLSANKLNESQLIHPLTTILIPLPNEPLSSQTRIRRPPPPPPVSSPIYPRNLRKKSRRMVHIGTGVGVALAVLCFILLLILYNLRRKRFVEARKERKRKQILYDFHDQMLKVYDFEELQTATDNFSIRNKLGESVYCGIIRDKHVAIKKMSANVEKEVEILNKINHFNFISLYGACEYEGLVYLVYEYMENGSLTEWLVKETGVEIQKWNIRIRIALDIAEGLHYIHNFTNPAYVHKGINSSNVLLNRALRAKISNFSFAKSSERSGFGYSSLRGDVGAKGYMAPEYYVSPKTDVYAFGVVLLELITGSKAVIKKDGEEVMLSEVVLSSVDSAHSWKRHVDPRLQVKHELGFIIDRSELEMRMMKLSLACLESDPSRRLNMAEVVSTLVKIQIDAQEPEYFSD